MRQLAKLYTLALLTFIILPLSMATAQHDMNQSPNVTEAVAVIHPTEGNKATGTVTFTKVNEGVRIQAELKGLKKQGKHGFHIHEKGDCTAADGTSAGGHFAPRDNKHGGPTDDVRHVGDMGNIKVDKNGNATLNYVDSDIKLNGPHSIVGRGIIVHKGEDDLESQPTGAAGPRAGCGVIGIVETE